MDKPDCTVKLFSGKYLYNCGVYFKEENCLYLSSLCKGNVCRWNNQDIILYLKEEPGVQGRIIQSRISCIDQQYQNC